MEYGVIGDIHGGIAALEAVWEALVRAGLSERTMLNAGDTVGYGDAPEACIHFLQARPNIMTVQGNYDKNVAKYPQKEAQFLKKWAESRPEKLDALRSDSAVISSASRAWLLSLPKEREITLDGFRILLTHYSPGGKEGLGNWTSDERLRELSLQTEASVVVCGHTHTPFARRAGDVLFVNPGTVGRPLSGRPSYAILTLAPGSPPAAQLRQVTL